MVSTQINRKKRRGTCEFTLESVLPGEIGCASGDCAAGAAAGPRQQHCSHAALKFCPKARRCSRKYMKRNVFKAESAIAFIFYICVQKVLMAEPHPRSHSFRLPASEELFQQRESIISSSNVTNDMLRHPLGRLLLQKKMPTQHHQKPYSSSDLFTCYFTRFVF